MFPVFQIGPLALQAPGLIIIAGIWLGLLAAENRSKHAHLDSNSIYNLVIIGLLVGIVGARLGYVIQYFSIFSKNLLNILSPTFTMLNSEAGLTLGVIASLIYLQRKKLAFWVALDVMTAGLSIFMVSFHLANLASGDAFGTQTFLPWAIQLWGQSRHPVQVYELAGSVLIAIALWKNKNPESVPGTKFWLFMALTSLARIFFEFFRGDSNTIFWNLHIAQIIAWLLLLISMGQLGVRLHQEHIMQKSLNNEMGMKE